jgi:glutaredoxin
MRLITGAFLILIAGSAGAQLYRWTDEQGRTHFTDSPPPKGAKNVQKMGGAQPAAKDAKGGSAPVGQEPFVLQQARKENPVTLYSTPGCDACVEARKLLNLRGIPFREVLVTEEAQIAEVKAAVGSNSVPSMVVGATPIRGYEEGAYNRALDNAGYPKAGILQPRNQAEPKPEGPKTEGATAAAPADAPAALGPYSPKPKPPAATKKGP